MLEFVVTMAFVVHKIHSSQHQMPHINLTIIFVWLIAEMKGVLLFSASVVLAVLVTVRCVQWGSQSWWRHPMEILSASLVLFCGEFTGHRWKASYLYTSSSETSSIGSYSHVFLIGYQNKLWASLLANICVNLTTRCAYIINEIVGVMGLQCKWFKKKSICYGSCTVGIENVRQFLYISSLYL